MRHAATPPGRGLRSLTAPALLLLAGAWGAGAQDAAGPGERISVDVPLVALRATILDSHHQPVSGLTKENAQVYENGVPQTVKYFQQEDTPVSAGIVVDHSGSMRPRIAQVIAGANTFATASNPGDEMFVINFNEHVASGLPPGVAFTGDPGALRTAIANYPVTGETALYDAVIEGLEKLTHGTKEAKVLLVISDGGDNASKHTAQQAIEAARKSEATIYCIGLFDEHDLHPDPGFLRKLAHSTGGEAFFPDETAEVVGICARIAKDIRARYTIGYSPADPRRDGSYRAIRVVARSRRGGKLEVRTRAGYYATPEERRPDVDAQ